MLKHVQQYSVQNCYDVLEWVSLRSVSSSLELSLCPLIGPSVQTHSRCFFLRPATGVSGQPSLSESDSRLSPVRGDRRLILGLVALSETARQSALLLGEVAGLSFCDGAEDELAGQEPAGNSSSE